MQEIRKLAAKMAQETPAVLNDSAQKREYARKLLKNAREEREVMEASLNEMKESLTTVPPAPAPYYNWCGDSLKFDNPCPVGAHPDCVEISKRLIEGEDILNLVEEYKLTERALYEHLARRHLDPSPAAQKQQTAIDIAGEELLDKMANYDSVEDEAEILRLINVYFFRVIRSMIGTGANAQDLLRFLREFRENILVRKRLREELVKTPLVQVTNVKIDKQQVILGDLLNAVDSLCSVCRNKVLAQVPGLNVGKLEHMIPVEEIMELPEGATPEYVMSTQKMYDAEYGIND